MNKLYGHSGCGPCRMIKQYLEEKKIPFKYMDVTDEKNLDELFELTGETKFPTFVTSDGEISSNPFSIKQMIDKLV